MQAAPSAAHARAQSDLALSNYVTYMNVLQAQLTSNTSNPTQGTLLYQVLLGNSPWTDGKGLQFSMPPPYQSNGDPIANGWALNDFQGFLFSFELLSTIGYGEIAPKSQGGQLWLCLFSLVRPSSLHPSSPLRTHIILSSPSRLLASASPPSPSPRSI